MAKKLITRRLLPLVCLALSSSAALSAPPLELPHSQEPTRKDLSKAMKAKALASSFEVVVPRPDEQSLTYEKELPWDLVPFQLRNDKYYSIGTAFAVSKTELVTAFHVIDPSVVSRTFPTFLIRDANGSVFELDQITGSDQQRDVVRFTVKGRVFESWLDLNPAFELNQAVFTVGNALGEGNVLRRGDLIGTIPEVVDGRWNLLKSSADVNGGNSGGPLLDLQGTVIGVVVQRNDNISLSLPVAELATLSTKAASFFGKYYMAFPLIPEESSAKTLEFELPLPSHYQEIKARAAEMVENFGDREMGAFLEEQAPDLFPNGDSSQEAIVRIPRSLNPQIYLKAPESRIWYLSDLDFRASTLRANGRLQVSALSADLIIGRIRPPDAVQVDDFFEDPKVLMDLIYTGLNFSRTVGGQDVRITSIGQPFRQAKLRDRWGRPWFQSIWLNPLEDQVLVVYVAPVPGGAVFLLREAVSSRLHGIEFDSQRILDFVHVPYAARIKEWQHFMKFPELHPESFMGLKLDIEVGQFLRMQSPWISLNIEQKNWPIEADGWLSLGMGFKSFGGQPALSVRNIVIEQDEKDDRFEILNHIKPFQEMDRGWFNDWRTVVKRLHPYDEQVFSEDGSSVIARLMSSSEGNSSNADSLFTLKLRRPGTMTASGARKDLGRLAASINIPADISVSAGRAPPAGGGK